MLFYSQFCVSASREFLNLYTDTCLSSCLTGIPIAGAILDAQNGQSYSGLIWFAGAAYIGAIFFFGAARVIGAGGGLMTKY